MFKFFSNLQDRNIEIRLKYTVRPGKWAIFGYLPLHDVIFHLVSCCAMSFDVIRC